MSFLIAGDTVPTKSNEKYFLTGQVDKTVDNSIINLFNSVGFRILNLETPLCNSEIPIDKCGPNLKAPIESVKWFSKMKIDLVSLANNHIMDYGEDGLVQTLDILHSKEINYVGVGKDENDASKAFFFNRNEKRIGIYSCSEHEFSIAGIDTIGANPFDENISFKHVHAIKEKCDYLIVLYHGGKEYYRYPSPLLQRRCRQLIENGADFVCCQHSHCIGCEEKYNGGVILYGQGNFVFDNADNEFWNSGLLVIFDDYLNISYKPIIKENHFYRIANEVETQKIMSDFYHRSELIKDQDFLWSNYAEFANGMIAEYLSSFNGFGGKNLKTFVFRCINKISNYKLQNYLLKRRNKHNLLMLLNFIECEAHRELLIQGLKNNLNIDRRYHSE